MLVFLSGQTSRTSFCIRIPASYTIRKRAGLETVMRAWLCFPQQAASLSFPPLRPLLMRVRAKEVSERVTYCTLMVKRRPSELTASLYTAGDRSWLQNPSYRVLPNSTSTAAASSSSESENHHSPAQLGKHSRQRREKREKRHRHKGWVLLFHICTAYLVCNNTWSTVTV